MVAAAICYPAAYLGCIFLFTKVDYQGESMKMVLLLLPLQDNLVLTFTFLLFFRVAVELVDPITKKVWRSGFGERFGIFMLHATSTASIP